MKKIFSLLLAVVLVLSFSACKDKNTSSDSDTTVNVQSGLNDDSNQTESDLQDSQESQDSNTSSEGETTSKPTTTAKPSQTQSTHTHKWQEATCKAPKTCSVCKTTQGKVSDHKYSDGKCIYCNKAAEASGGGQASADTYADYINYRGYNTSLSGNKYAGALSNTYKKLSSEKELTVVYLGGSVTYGYGSEDRDQKGSWRGRVGDWLTATFPEATINNINRAIGDTGSKLGLYRLNRDVISQKPDLLFIEFSINDYYEGADYMRASTQFETIIRRVKEALPECDIVTILVTDRNEVTAAHTTEEKAGELHLQAKAHEYISKKYNISSIHVGRALADEIFAVGGGVYSLDVWKQYVKDGVHPYNKGYGVYFNVIKEFLSNALLSGECEGCQIVKQELPKPINLQLLDGEITHIDDTDAAVTFTKNNGATHSPNTATSDTWADGGGHKGFISFPKGSTDTVTVKFTGTELVMVLTTGLSSSNSFQYSIDNGATWNIGVCSSKNPITVVKDLPAKEYTVIIRPAVNSDISIDCFYSRNAE